MGVNAFQFLGASRERKGMLGRVGCLFRGTQVALDIFRMDRIVDPAVEFWSMRIGVHRLLQVLRA
jgi:hypothetical protein